MTELVLFDLDGTLIDTAPDMVPAMNEVLAMDGRPPLPYERLRVHVSYGSTGLLLDAYGPELQGEALEQRRALFLERYRARLARESVLFPGIGELLDLIEARGMRWGVVTNKPGWLTDPLLVELELGERIACVVSGDTLAERKPDPTPLLHACEMANVDATRAVYVGDAERDIAAAIAAGMPGYVALFGYIAPEEKPDLWGATALLETPADLWRHLPDHAIAASP
ncbi:MAG: phosphoglycolate phosphatase [Halofilum sp. (in: g-proteobacteria)]|nr:phosphoglycolate phosphatase [Halofilum sp. (in: g-proteobacteria)]